MRINRAQAYSSERFLHPAASQRTKVVKSDWNARNVGAGIELNRRIVRRILNDIERHVTEIPFVCHPVATAQAGLAVACYVPGNSYPRRKVIRIYFPQFADGTVLR